MSSVPFGGFAALDTACVPWQFGSYRQPSEENMVRRRAYTLVASPDVRATFAELSKRHRYHSERRRIRS